MGIIRLKQNSSCAVIFATKLDVAKTNVYFFWL